MSNDVLETVKRFATALDDEDYRALESLLAADCRYESPRGTLIGLLAVIGSYR
jgi:limonene-1,2-epoxide hydrolase